jgi:hypothetical protein
MVTLGGSKIGTSKENQDLDLDQLGLEVAKEMKWEDNVEEFSKDEIHMDLILLKGKMEGERRLKITEKSKSPNRRPIYKGFKDIPEIDPSPRIPKVKNKPSIPTVNRSKSKIVEKPTIKYPQVEKKPEVPKFKPLQRQKSTSEELIFKVEASSKPISENVIKMKEYADKVRNENNQKLIKNQENFGHKKSKSKSPDKFKNIVSDSINLIFNEF